MNGRGREKKKVSYHFKLSTARTRNGNALVGPFQLLVPCARRLWPTTKRDKQPQTRWNRLTRGKSREPDTQLSLRRKRLSGRPRPVQRIIQLHLSAAARASRLRPAPRGEEHRGRESEKRKKKKKKLKQTKPKTAAADSEKTGFAVGAFGSVAGSSGGGPSARIYIMPFLSLVLPSSLVVRTEWMERRGAARLQSASSTLSDSLASVSVSSSLSLWQHPKLCH